MEPALGVALLWLVFGGMHVGLTTGHVRAALVRRLGERGFLGLFSVIASLSFAALVHYYAVHRFAGAAGPALGAAGAVRSILLAPVVAGLVLVIASMASYLRSPYAISNDGLHVARGLERITRHPFFVGVGMAAGAHALLAPHLAGSVFCAGLAALALGGAWHQDRKLLARRGRVFAEFLATTSLMPFGAIVAGRQRLVLRELPWTVLALAVGAIVLLRRAHAGIFAHGGLWVIATVVGGAAILMAQDLWVARGRAGRRHAQAAGAATTGR
jgi:uncharacterized membrane protein